jgi:hypothetical protein
MSGSEYLRFINDMFIVKFKFQGKYFFNVYLKYVNVVA